MTAVHAHTAFIALGSNLDNPQKQIGQAFDALNSTAQTRLLSQSSLYRSAPVGCPGEQPDFINAVAKIATDLTPQQLLEALLKIEQQGGRVRSIQNAPRTLDLDLLLYDDLQYQQQGLTIPHPRMHQRAFVLQPLSEIEPDITIPGIGKASDCLTQCRDQALEKLPAASAPGRFVGQTISAL